ncbi:hypothetical protein V5O48_017609 [Marasmius crinis-equi]|uniref:BTB domain-containing protein n=1 Tax=Marasmius crinis-equi TaxID=585013 RepID=A0ABR3ENH7_9AGAR
MGEVQMHPDIDFPDANLFIQSDSDTVVFGVYKGLIARRVTVFSDMFALPQPGGSQGTSTETAIAIPQVTTAEIEAFLRFVSGLETLQKPLSIDFCLRLLKLSHRFQYREGYGTAVQDVIFQATWVQKVVLGKLTIEDAAEFSGETMFLFQRGEALYIHTFEQLLSQVPTSVIDGTLWKGSSCTNHAQCLRSIAATWRQIQEDLQKNGEGRRRNMWRLSYILDTYQFPATNLLCKIHFHVDIQNCLKVFHEGILTKIVGKFIPNPLPPV